MKNAEALFDEGLEIVGNVVGKQNILPIKRPITINYRATSRWGRCIKNQNRCNIELSNRILDDKVPTSSTMSVIIHEILHACKNCSGHTGTWKYYAEKVNRLYPQYKISRCASSEEFNLKEEQLEIKCKYAIKCTRCGKIHYSSKLSKTIIHPEYYRCHCGGNLERIK